MFPKWQDKVIIGGLSSEALIIVDTTAQQVKEIQRIDMKNVSWFYNKRKMAVFGWLRMGNMQI